MTTARRQPAKSNGSARPAGDGTASPWLAADPNGEGLEVFDFPTYMFGRISGIVRRSLIPRYVEPAGLSIPEWRLLAFLVLSKPVSFNEICAALTMDRAQVSRTIPVLSGKGIIKRTVTVRKGPRRRGEAERQTRLTATSKGHALYRRALPLAQRHQMLLLGALDVAERETLYFALQKMTRAAEQFERQHVAETKSVKQAASRIGKPKRAPSQAARKLSKARGHGSAAVELQNGRANAGGLT